MITEKDIFNYVFFKHLVKKEDIQEIEKADIYADALRFYNSLKEYMEDDIPFKLKKKLSLKIPSYEPRNKFVLYAINDEKLEKKNVVRFAAASAGQKDKLIAKTFLDEGKNYLIRFIKKNTESKIYVFSTRNEIIKNFKIVAYPMKQTIEISNNSEPVILSTGEIPDYFELVFK